MQRGRGKKCILRKVASNLSQLYSLSSGYEFKKVICFMAKLTSLSSWKNKQIQKAYVFYFQEGKIKHEIDFSSPLVEGRNHISHQAFRLQPFLINLLHHVLKPTDFIFCCNLHAEV